MSRAVPFVKAHACGNDFLVIDEVHAGSDHGATARRLCDRHTGIGADGVEFLDRKTDESLFLRLFNADGSEAELSGNGTRCVAAWLGESEGRTEVTFGTHGGTRQCRLVERRGVEFRIESSMGVPRVMRRTVQIEGIVGEIEGAMVHVGNPHFVLFPEREDFGSQGLRWEDLGRAISTHPMFRFGTNVEFVRVLAADEIEFRIFERGCGPTMSSGTGTCAAAAAAIVLRGAARDLKARAPGGTQSVRWPEDRAEMALTGPAVLVCKGEAWL